MTNHEPRITARVDSDTQDLLAKAAAISGMKSTNAFIVSAAVEKAKKIIERERLFKLSHDDAMLLVEALDQEGKPNSRLTAAVKKYRSRS